MIQQLELGNEKVMALRVEGKIDQQESASVIEYFEKKLNTADKLNIYMEIPKIQGIEARGIWDSIKAGFANLKKYNDKVERVAVVTDKNWLQTAASVENRLFPGIDEKAFSMEEAEVAKKWVRA